MIYSSARVELLRSDVVITAYSNSGKRSGGLKIIDQNKNNIQTRFKMSE